MSKYEQNESSRGRERRERARERESQIDRSIEIYRERLSRANGDQQCESKREHMRAAWRALLTLTPPREPQRISDELSEEQLDVMISWALRYIADLKLPVKRFVDSLSILLFIRPHSVCGISFFVASCSIHLYFCHLVILLQVNVWQSVFLLFIVR